MVQPINVIFRYLQQQTPVCFWLYDNVETRIEGKIIVSDFFSVRCTASPHGSQVQHAKAKDEPEPLDSALTDTSPTGL